MQDCGPKYKAAEHALSVVRKRKMSQGGMVDSPNLKEDYDDNDRLSEVESVAGDALGEYPEDLEEMDQEDSSKSFDDTAAISPSSDESAERKRQFVGSYMAHRAVRSQRGSMKR